MREFEFERIDWQKMDGLVPAIVQDDQSGEVLMLGYMSPEALERTLETKKVTFWSRTRQKLWTKGESSGNSLTLRSIQVDCDGDTLLVRAIPSGPVCHLMTPTCFSERNEFEGLSFLSYLERLVQRRREEMPSGSYTTQLFERGETQICKKLGEEAVEVIVSVNQEKERTVEEVADLLYHLLVFLSSREVSLADIMDELKKRHLK